MACPSRAFKDPLVRYRGGYSLPARHADGGQSIELGSQVRVHFRVEGNGRDGDGVELKVAPLDSLLGVHARSVITQLLSRRLVLVQRVEQHRLVRRDLLI